MHERKVFVVSEFKILVRKLLPFGQGHSTPKVYMRLMRGLNRTGKNAATGWPVYPLPITPTVHNTEGFHC